MSIFPTDYSDKTTLVDGDKTWGYDSEAVANKNFSLLSIFNYIVGKITTTNVAEGTNKYVTDTNLDATTTITTIKSDITDLESTRELTANKKTSFSVVDNIGYPTTQAIVNYIAALGLDITGLTAETTIEDTDELPFYDTSATSNKKITRANLRDNVYVTSSTVTTTNSTFTHVITHNLGRIPKEIDFKIIDGLDASEGYYYNNNYGYVSNLSSLEYNGTDAIGRVKDGTTSDFFKVTVTNITTTQVTLTFTENGSCDGAATYYYIVKIK